MYRVNQFISYFISFFKKLDNKFINLYLNQEELYYFNKLFKTEKQHSVKVAKKCLEVFKEFDIQENEVNSVVKMCLLHDVGKGCCKVNLFMKPFIVIISKYKPYRKLLFFINKNRIYDYMKHSKYSFNILSKFNYSNEVLNSIKYHHSSRNVINNKYIKLLKYCDKIAF